MMNFQLQKLDMKQDSNQDVTEEKTMEPAVTDPNVKHCHWLMCPGPKINIYI